MMFRFKGTNGSMGLITGNRYSIYTEEQDGTITANVMLTANPIKVGVQEYAGTASEVPFMPYVYIPYDSIEAFERNWQQVADCRCTTPGEDDGSTTCWIHHDCTTGDCTHGE